MFMANKCRQSPLLQKLFSSWAEPGSVASYPYTSALETSQEQRGNVDPRQNLSFSTVSVIWGKVQRLKKSRNSNASCYRYVYNTARLRHQELLIPPVGHCLLVFVGRIQHEVEGARQTWWCSGLSPPLPRVIEFGPVGRPCEPWVPQVQRGDMCGLKINIAHQALSKVQMPPTCFLFGPSSLDCPKNTS